MTKKFESKFYFIGFLSLLVWSTSVFSLEMDEKLTVRVLSLSNSKKTMLVNRGLEDGLVVGDHAKFFLTTGVVARGVVVKASPSRSIWSVYRLVNPQEIETDKVVNLKISTPVKLTEDPSKMLAESHSEFEAGTEGLSIPVERGDISPEVMASKSSGNELDELEDVRGSGIDKKHVEESIPVVQGSHKSGANNQWTLEVWGLTHFNGLSTTSDNGTAATSSGKQSFMDFSVGVEKYFAEKQNWLHNFSLNVMLHNNIQELTGIENSDELKQSSFEYGAGVHWHFLEDPFTYGRPFAFASLYFGFGNTNDSATIPATNYNESFKGSSSFFSLGVGGKYYIQNGFGARVLVDYYRRSEKYEISSIAATYAKVVAGPRIMAGLSYRW